MTNVNNPIGFWPVGHLTGGEIRTHEYVLTTGSTVFKGDVVKAVAAGTVQPAAAGDDLVVIGVAAEYVSDAGSVGGRTIQVYDDPYIIFGVQASGGVSLNQLAVFATANHVVGAGNPVTLLSGHQLNTATIGTTGQLKILGIVDAPNNFWGEFVDLKVVFAKHMFNAAVPGV